MKHQMVWDAHDGCAFPYYYLDTTGSLTNTGAFILFLLSHKIGFGFFFARFLFFHISLYQTLAIEGEVSVGFAILNTVLAVTVPTMGERHYMGCI